MKQRITYIAPAGNNLAPSDIVITDEGVDFAQAHESTEEWRLTLGLDELPDELRTVLVECDDLHVRWTSSQRQSLESPFVSRVPPGLHIFWTPKDPTAEYVAINYCMGQVLTVISVTFYYLAQELLGDGAICSSATQTCSKNPILLEGSNALPTFHFFENAPLMSTVAETFLSNVCKSDSAQDSWHLACKDPITQLESASNVDIDFDAESKKLIFSVLWGPQASGEFASGRSTRQYRHLGAADRLEVGMLQGQGAKKPGELSLGGYLTVIGEDSHPKPTFFSFPSRHHLPKEPKLTFTTSFRQPTGLHPKLQISLPAQHLVPPEESCTLHTYMTLPSTLFIDEFQLGDELFLASQNLMGVNSLIGERDLEAPDWVVRSCGSAALLQLALPGGQDTSHGGDWGISVPLHLRYVNEPQSSADAANERDIEVVTPVVFWACEAAEGISLSNNPFDRTNLGYDNVFGPHTVFHHIPQAQGAEKATLQLRMPVLAESTGEVVQSGTLLMVLIAFAWVCWQLLATSRSPHANRNHVRKDQ